MWNGNTKQADIDMDSGRDNGHFQYIAQHIRNFSRLASHHQWHQQPLSCFILGCTSSTWGQVTYPIWSWEISCLRCGSNPSDPSQYMKYLINNFHIPFYSLSRYPWPKRFTHTFRTLAHRICILASLWHRRRDTKSERSKQHVHHKLTTQLVLARPLLQ